MRISFKSAITLLLAVSIAVGVLLYPARGSCITIILKDTEEKILDPSIEPNIQCGEPGFDPYGKATAQGSTLLTDVDPRDLYLPKTNIRKPISGRFRHFELLLNYLRNFSRRPQRF